MTASVRQGDVFLIPGDVFLIPVTAIPEGATEMPRDNGRVVLAYGEVTGHSHAIADPNAAQFRTATDARFLRIVGTAVTIGHEEHANIELDPGISRVVIAREFTRAMVARRVVD